MVVCITFIKKFFFLCHVYSILLLFFPFTAPNSCFFISGLLLDTCLIQVQSIRYKRRELFDAVKKRIPVKLNRCKTYKGIIDMAKVRECFDNV